MLARAAGRRLAIPDIPEVSGIARTLVDFFFELSNQRHWRADLRPTEEGFVSERKPQPLAHSEIICLMDERGYAGAERDFMLEGVLHLDGQWRKGIDGDHGPEDDEEDA